MEKINPNFQNYKNNYIYSISVFINEVLIFLSLLFTTIFIFCFKKKNNTQIILGANEINRPEIGMNRNISLKSQNINQINKENSNIMLNEQKNEIKLEKHLCIICFTNPTKVILYPCRHKCICEKCYAPLKNTPKDIKRCPICRRDVISVIDEVYEV